MSTSQNVGVRGFPAFAHITIGILRERIILTLFVDRSLAPVLAECASVIVDENKYYTRSLIRTNTTEQTTIDHSQK